MVKHRFMETISAAPSIPTLFGGGMVGNPDAQDLPIESVAESSVSIKQKNVDPVTMSATRDRECRTDAESSRFGDLRTAKTREVPIIQTSAATASPGPPPGQIPM